MRKHRPHPYSGKYGPTQKPGLIHLRSGFAEEKAAEQQLQHPAQRCTDEKQEGKRQKNIHGSSMRHALGFVDIIIFCFRPKRKGDDSVCQKVPPGFFCQSCFQNCKI